MLLCFPEEEPRQEVSCVWEDILFGEVFSRLIFVLPDLMDFGFKFSDSIFDSNLVNRKSKQHCIHLGCRKVLGVGSDFLSFLIRWPISQDGECRICCICNTGGMSVFLPMRCLGRNALSVSWWSSWKARFGSWRPVL